MSAVATPALPSNGNSQPVDPNLTKEQGQDTEGSLPKQDPVAAGREWRETLRSSPGHEEGFSAGPAEALKTFNVSSAAQLPYILAELNAHGGSIRINFPTSSPENAETTKEQQAIREFLQNHHNAGLEQLTKALTAFLENSHSYKKLEAQPDFALKFPTARDWVTAHLVQEISSDVSLKVADIISAEEIAKKSEPDLRVSLEESTKAGRETIITVPPQSDTLDSIREKLQNFVAKDGELLNKPISVWTNVSNSDIRSTPFKVSSIKQLSLREFLATKPTSPKKTEPAPRDVDPPKADSEIPAPNSKSQPEPTMTTQSQGSLILTNLKAPNLQEETTESQPTEAPRSSSSEERVALWQSGLQEIDQVRDSLRKLLPLAEEVLSLEGKLKWAKDRVDSAFRQVKPLLDATTDSEGANTNETLDRKGHDEEFSRARRHKSNEGKAFNRALYVMQGAEKKLADAREKLHTACKDAALDSILTPKGETAPVITRQSIVDALGRQGRHAGKIRGKIRRSGGAVGTSHMEGTSEEAVITSPTPKDKRSQSGQDTTSRQTGHERKLRALNEKIERKSAYLKEAREMLERAENMTGPWADGEEAKSLESRGSLIDDQEKALRRIAELEALQKEPSTREMKNVAEINTILKQFRMNNVVFFRDLVARRKEDFEAHMADFLKSHAERQQYWSKRVIDLQGELDTLRAKLPQTDATPGDLPMETNVDEQTAVVQDSELAALDKPVSGDSESAAS